MPFRKLARITRRPAKINKVEGMGLLLLDCLPLRGREGVIFTDSLK